MVSITNQEIAELLFNYCELLDVEGADQFRVDAYRRATVFVRKLEEPLTRKLDRGERLQDLPSIGDTLARQIEDIIRTGHFAELDNLRHSVSPVEAQLLRVDGIGPKRFRILERYLGRLTPGTVLKAANSGALAGLPGIGSRLQANIRDAFRK